MILYATLNDVSILVMVEDLNELIQADSDATISYYEEVSEESGTCRKGDVVFLRVDQDKQRCYPPIY